jgi:hypothetical protein
VRRSRRGQAPAGHRGTQQVARARGLDHAP